MAACGICAVTLRPFRLFGLPHAIRTTSEVKQRNGNCDAHSVVAEAPCYAARSELRGEVGASLGTRKASLLPELFTLRLFHGNLRARGLYSLHVDPRSRRFD